MRCPHCNNRILQKSEGAIKVRTHGPITFNEAGECETKCHWCKGRIILPMELSKSVDVEEARFIISKS